MFSNVGYPTQSKKHVNAYNITASDACYSYASHSASYGYAPFHAEFHQPAWTSGERKGDCQQKKENAAALV